MANTRHRQYPGVLPPAPPRVADTLLIGLTWLKESELEIYKKNSADTENFEKVFFDVQFSRINKILFQLDLVSLLRLI